MVMATAVLEHYAPVDLTNSHIFYKRNYGALNDGDQPKSVAPRDLISEALRKRTENVNPESCEPGEEDTFFVADLGQVYRQHMRWKLNLPRVKPFYAVKCNPDPKVLQLLSELGTGFDCASKAEIEQVLNMNIDPDRIIYAQPCKTTSYVRFVAARGVRQMTFDNADELYKIARLYPGAELFLRIATDDSASLCRLSLKFGAALSDADGLLALARSLGLNVVGVSFHVGSGASDPHAFLKAVRDAHTVFITAEAHGFNLRVLDVGGGFCADATFETMAAVLRAALDEYFPPHSGVSLIAEPGRYYVSTAFTIACNVIARRTIENSPPAPDVSGIEEGEELAIGAAPAPFSGSASYMLYLNDGLYGNFSSIMFDHQHPVAKVLRAGGHFLYGTEAAEPQPPSSSALSSSVGGSASIEYSIWGPTCDGIDRITESTHFAGVLDVGDWLYFEDMGAYTKCSATKFNGFSDNHDVIYVCSEPGARALLGI